MAPNFKPILPLTHIKLGLPRKGWPPPPLVIGNPYLASKSSAACPLPPRDFPFTHQSKAKDESIFGTAIRNSVQMWTPYSLVLNPTVLQWPCSSANLDILSTVFCTPKQLLHYGSKANPTPGPTATFSFQSPLPLHSIPGRFHVKSPPRCISKPRLTSLNQSLTRNNPDQAEGKTGQSGTLLPSIHLAACQNYRFY